MLASRGLRRAFPLSVLLGVTTAALTLAALAPAPALADKQGGDRDQRGDRGGDWSGRGKAEWRKDADRRRGDIPERAGWWRSDDRTTPAPAEPIRAAATVAPRPGASVNDGTSSADSAGVAGGPIGGATAEPASAQPAHAPTGSVSATGMSTSAERTIAATPATPARRPIPRAGEIGRTVRAGGVCGAACAGQHNEARAVRNEATGPDSDDPFAAPASAPARTYAERVDPGPVRDEPRSTSAPAAGTWAGAEGTDLSAPRTLDIEAAQAERVADTGADLWGATILLAAIAAAAVALRWERRRSAAKKSRRAAAHSVASHGACAPTGLVARYEARRRAEQVEVAHVAR